MTIGDISKTPRWFLLLVAGGGMGLAGAWAAHVEEHINEANQGYQRISALEARVNSLEAHRDWCRARHGN